MNGCVKDGGEHRHTVNPKNLEANMSMGLAAYVN